MNKTFTKRFEEVLFEAETLISGCKTFGELRLKLINFLLINNPYISDFNVDYKKFVEAIPKLLSCIEEDNSNTCKNCEFKKECSLFIFMMMFSDMVKTLVSVPSELEVQRENISFGDVIYQ